MGSPKRRLAVVVVGVVIGLFVLLLPHWQTPTSHPAAPAPGAGPAPSTGVTARPPSAVPSPAASPVRAPDEVDAFEGIEKLNAPGYTVKDDLILLGDLLLSWQTLFPRQGNPWGENRDITTSLTGSNGRSIALLPRRHPAINAAGELIDRWGTPYFFHQLSGTRMEIRSAGPDRVLYTDDDAVATP